MNSVYATKGRHCGKTWALLNSRIEKLRTKPMTCNEFIEIRLSLGINQINMAAVLGVHPRTIRNWESQKSPDINACRVLDNLIEGITKCGKIL